MQGPTEGCDEAKHIGTGQRTLNSERAQKCEGKGCSLGGLGRGHRLFLEFLQHARHYYGDGCSADEETKARKEIKRLTHSCTVSKKENFMICTHT